MMNTSDRDHIMFLQEFRYKQECDWIIDGIRRPHALRFLKRRAWDRKACLIRTHLNKLIRTYGKNEVTDA